MKGNLLFCLFMALSLFILPVAQASEGLAHNHGAISPFGDQKHGHKIHCELNKHHSSNIYCPHSFAKKHKEKIMIVPDCADKTGALPAFGFNANVLSFDTTHVSAKLALIIWEMAYLSYGPCFFLPDQIDHPPQNV